MPIDHFNLTVPEDKLDKFIAFLVTALAPVGFAEIMRPRPAHVGLGENRRPYFWLVGCSDEKVREACELNNQQQHIAFAAQDVDQIHRFYDLALAAGATDNGGPGPRPEYHSGYYSAFVRDPVCGMNIELVYHMWTKPSD